MLLPKIYALRLSRRRDSNEIFSGDQSRQMVKRRDRRFGDNVPIIRHQNPDDEVRDDPSKRQFLDAPDHRKKFHLSYVATKAWTEWGLRKRSTRFSAPSTFNVRRMERNFLLSPISIALLMHGSCAFTSSSINTGGTFSPPAVIISSYKSTRHLKVKRLPEMQRWLFNLNFVISDH